MEKFKIGDVVYFKKVENDEFLRIGIISDVYKQINKTMYRIYGCIGAWEEKELELVEENKQINKSDFYRNEPHIKDSGERTEYKTGAVRDCKSGKGRCDLLPLDVMADYFQLGVTEEDIHNKDLFDNYELYYSNHIFRYLSKFKETGNLDCIYCAVDDFCEKAYNSNFCEMILELSKHFEDGCNKYGENNWQKGIPIHSYIDSAIRHYLKYIAGWNDEPHDRAFVWNLVCCAWTMKNKPEMDDFTVKNKNGN